MPASYSATESSQPRMWSRNAVVLAATTGVLGIAVGAAAGKAATDTHSSDLKTANAKVTALSSDLTTARSTLAPTQAEVSTALQKAANATTAAQAEAKAQDAATRQRLAAQQSSLNARSHQLDVRERKVTGEIASYKRNTIPGDGEFLVGKEIQPGIYHADASVGCYWARLGSLDTTNINDNDNVDGPVTIQVYATDKALQLQGCADFHKIG